MKFKEIIKIIKIDGWYQVRQVGSHQQYHHFDKISTVTIVEIKFRNSPKTV
ncbi:MAG: type II toxin-antitoxin system HicA family toxin [Ignavibacteria bacterium]|nr:type II toxin-antitoxin system HicA family toxin [Ignavibacteria bacterium]